MTQFTTLPCSTCGHSVAREAKRCPSCDAKRPAPTAANLVRAIGGLLVLVVVLVAMFGGFSGSAAKPADAATSASALSQVASENGGCFSESGTSMEGASVTVADGKQLVTLTDGAVFEVRADGQVVNDNPQADRDTIDGTDPDC